LRNKWACTFTKLTFSYVKSCRVETTSGDTDASNSVELTVVGFVLDVELRIDVLTIRFLVTVSSNFNTAGNAFRWLLWLL